MYLSTFFLFNVSIFNGLVVQFHFLQSNLDEMRGGLQCDCCRGETLEAPWGRPPSGAKCQSRPCNYWDWIDDFPSFFTPNFFQNLTRSTIDRSGKWDGFFGEIHWKGGFLYIILKSTIELCSSIKMTLLSKKGSFTIKLWWNRHENYTY